MDRGLVGTDEGASSLLSFIVGMAVLTGSLAIATYFIVTVPDEGSSEETKQLEGATHRSVETLTTSPGQPSDWAKISDLSTDQLRRVGLQDTGKPHYASIDKIDRLQRGHLNESRILRSWDLDPDTYELRIEGRVQTVSIGDTPSVDTVGVAHAEGDAYPSAALSQDTKDAAKLYAEVNDGYTFSEHDWEFNRTTHPSTGLGTTVKDHPFYIETQLFPKMAGIEATYAAADHGKERWDDDAAATEAFERYDETINSPGKASATRWHVVKDGDPYDLPADPASDDGDYVLGLSWRPDNAGGTGWGTWPVQDGARTTALLGDFNVGTATSAKLTFDHALKVRDEGIECDSIDDTSCSMIRPSILFWNTTGTDQWTRLDNETTACSPAAAETWNDTLDAEATSQSFKTKTVDLCEALEHSDTTMWLSFFWDSSCLDGDGANTTCSEERVARGWWLDDMHLDVDGKTVWETSFEPKKDADQEVFISNGVDHKRTYWNAHDHMEDNLNLFIRDSVQNGTSLVSLTPEAGPAGSWLSSVGLSVNETTHNSDVHTNDSGDLVLNYPNVLPTTSPDYSVENASWQNNTPHTPSNWTLPANFTPLNAIQTSPDGNNVTLIAGQPYDDSGNVVGVTYNYTHFSNETLRKELFENIQVRSAFADPSFTVGSELPDPGSKEVSSDRRVLLVEVTNDGRYVVPLEITMWMWRG